MDHQALTSPIDRPAFYEKMLQYRPEKVAFTSNKAPSPFFWTADEGDCAGSAAGRGRFPNRVRAGLAIRRRIGSLVYAAVAGAGGFDETHFAGRPKAG